MSQSVTSTEDSEQLESMTRADIAKMIADEVKSLSVESIINRNKADMDFVKQIQFMSTCTKEDDVTALGSALCSDLIRLFSKIQPILAHVVVNDYPLSSAIELCSQETNALRTRVNALTVSTANSPAPPPPYPVHAVLRAQLVKQRELNAEHVVALAALQAPAPALAALQAPAPAHATRSASAAPAEVDAASAAAALAATQAAIAQEERNHTARLADATEAVQLQFLDRQVELDAAHQTALLQYQADRTELAQKTLEVKGKEQECTVLEGLRLLDNVIGQRIMTRMSTFYGFADALGTSVVPSTTGIEIKDFLSGPSLAGIYHALWQKFRKPTTANFSHSLLSLVNFRLSAEETLLTPLKAVTEAERQYTNWYRKNYLALLTPDVLFAVAIVTALAPGTDARFQASKSLRTACEQLAAGTLPTASGDRPIMHAVKHDLEAFYDTQKFTGKAPGTPAPASTRPPSPSPYKRGAYQNRFAPRGDAETAAAADAAPRPKLIQINPGTPKFTAEVPLSMNYGTYNQEKHKVFPYVARSTAEQVCSSCASGDGKKCGCGATLTRCIKCQLFGHRSGECHQQASHGGSKSN